MVASVSPMRSAVWPQPEPRTSATSWRDAPVRSAITAAAALATSKGSVAGSARSGTAGCWLTAEAYRCPVLAPRRWDAGSAHSQDPVAPCRGDRSGPSRHRASVQAVRPSCLPRRRRRRSPHRRGVLRRGDPRCLVRHRRRRLRKHHRSHHRAECQTPDQHRGGPDHARAGGPPGPAVHPRARHHQRPADPRGGRPDVPRAGPRDVDEAGPRRVPGGRCGDHRLRGGGLAGGQPGPGPGHRGCRARAGQPHLEPPADAAARRGPGR